MPTMRRGEVLARTVSTRRLRDKGGTEVQRRSFNWVALVGIGLAGVVAVSAASALAAARSAATPFELVFHARHEPCPECRPFATVRHVGSFTSGAPFCESGTAEDVGWFRRRTDSDDSVIRHYACADGSGSLLLSIASLQAEHARGAGSEWTIDQGSGRFEGLRGKGTSGEELLGGNPQDPATITATGFVGTADAIAPSLAFTSASAAKLRRPAGVYSIRVAFSLQDDVEGPPVAYKLGVTEGRHVLASTTGTTASGSVSTTLRVRPSSKRVRSVVLRLYGSDWIGNELSIARSLRLPR
jgi:hypothetical protein